MRFVNTLGLGQEPSIEPVRRRLAGSPGVRFKLDAEASWAPAPVDQVVATGAVDTIDFKGQYGFEVKDPAALCALYHHLLAPFVRMPTVPEDHTACSSSQSGSDQRRTCASHAPIRSAEDIGRTPWPRAS